MLARMIDRRSTDPWARFEQAARQHEPDGIRSMVPVIGTGFNAQAGVTLGWGDLLAAVQRDIGASIALPTGDALVGNTTLAWEAMVAAGASHSQRATHQVEATMLTSVARLLREHYRADGPTAPFARAFLGLGFRDVVSFNFDEVLHVERARWHHAPRESVSGTPFRKTTSHAALPSGARLWYPHGFVRFPQAIQLGMRNYGTAMIELETARGRHKAVERALERRGDARDVAALLRRDARSWIDVAMTAPLVFVGLSMGREEWPMWWFLNQRARNHARSSAPPVFAFMRAPEADRMADAARLAGIELLRFTDYRSGWDRLLSAFR